MAEEFDADAAAKQLAEVVKSTAETARASVPAGAPQPLFREDENGNLLTRAGVLVRPKLAPLQLGGK